jgi:cytochrome c oxidase subunit IV
MAGPRTWLVVSSRSLNFQNAHSDPQTYSLCHVKFKLPFLSYKAEIFMLIWNLHVELILIFEILRSTIIVSKFSSIFCFKTLCPIFFPIFHPKFIIFIFYSLQILSYEFHFSVKFLYRSFVFEHICISKFFYNFFTCIYFVFEQII